MTGLWLLCLLGAVAGGVPPSDRANSPCSPGAVWVADDGCNTCYCLQNGVPGCTFIECSARDPENARAGESDLKPLPLPEPEDEKAKAYTVYGGESREPQPLPLPEFDDGWRPDSASTDSEMLEPKPVEERSGVNCTSGDVWQEDCNTCQCLEDGKAACTKVACLSDDRALFTSVRGRCEAGVTWSDACNVCHCIDASQVICSYRTCAGAESRRRRRQATCTPGTSRQVDCNTCLCLPNGREACSRKFCLPESSQSAGQFSGTGRAAEDSGDDTKCPQQCPADCGAFRGEDGCLRCRCDHSPFPGLRPLPDTESGADRDHQFSASETVDTGFEVHKVPVSEADGWYASDADPVDPGFEAQPGWMLSGR